MNIYRYEEDDRVPRLSLSVDPGITTSGVSILDRESREFQWVRIPKRESRTMGVALPELYVEIHSQIENIMSTIQALDVCGTSSWDWRETELLIEYTFLQGLFSVGLGAFVCTLVERARMGGCPRVSFIPPRIPEFFYRKKSVSDKETKELFRMLYPSEDVRKIPVHTIDASLFNIFYNFEFFPEHSGRLRYPVYDLIRFSFPDLIRLDDLAQECDADPTDIDESQNAVLPNITKNT